MTLISECEAIQYMIDSCRTRFMVNRLYTYRQAFLVFYVSSLSTNLSIGNAFIKLTSKISYPSEVVLSIAYGFITDARRSETTCMCLRFGRWYQLNKESASRRQVNGLT